MQSLGHVVVVVVVVVVVTDDDDDDNNSCLPMTLRSVYMTSLFPVVVCNPRAFLLSSNISRLKASYIIPSCPLNPLT